ncbi:hypothetical protein C7477_12156 [Phyllobacterium leguminum]|uniref:Uncharacterized protein n=1 Tax=Phyllobacterium leguminum TaxID=314237 RepID=A0A318T247_9HYPH|nr:hypothetical protein C7477_12156 [Phyllobacterium leguminum]
MILLSFLISWGERPLTPYDATCGDEQMGEANRVLPGSHKSAEPIKVGRLGTSDPAAGPASELAMARETEPMVDAPVDTGTRQLGSGRVDLWCEPKIGGALVCAMGTRTEGAQRAAHQLRYGLAWYRGQIPHGVKSAPKAGERSVAEPKNLIVASGSFRPRMAEATSDRDDKGRSLRSSPRAGKPSTWRREAVDTASRQEVDVCPTR